MALIRGYAPRTSARQAARLLLLYMSKNWSTQSPLLTVALRIRRTTRRHFESLTEWMKKNRRSGMRISLSAYSSRHPISVATNMGNWSGGRRSNPNCFLHRERCCQLHHAPEKLIDDGMHCVPLCWCFMFSIEGSRSVTPTRNRGSINQKWWAWKDSNLRRPLGRLIYSQK
jgi:hypothetical protein